MEPLAEIGGIVLAQAQVDVLRIVEADDLDRTGIEARADLHRSHSSRRRNTRVSASDAAAAKA